MQSPPKTIQFTSSIYNKSNKTNRPWVYWNCSWTVLWITIVKKRQVGLCRLISMWLIKIKIWMVKIFIWTTIIICRKNYELSMSNSWKKLIISILANRRIRMRRCCRIKELRNNDTMPCCKRRWRGYEEMRCPAPEWRRHTYNRTNSWSTRRFKTRSTTRGC